MFDAIYVYVCARACSHSFCVSCVVQRGSLRGRFFALALGVVARMLLKVRIFGAVKMPYTAALLVIGILFGIWNHEMDLQELGESFDMWYGALRCPRSAVTPERDNRCLLPCRVVPCRVQINYKQNVDDDRT